jgi:AbiV family abortive infection protein
MGKSIWDDKLSERLTPTEMGRGIAAANRNARRLLGDAILLYENYRYPSAAALATLAMEESAKWWALLHVTVLQDAKAIANAWRDHRRHVTKLDRAIAIVKDAFERSGGEVVATPSTELARATQALKERCIYTDFIKDRRWTEPSGACDAALCRGHLGGALVMVTRYHITGRYLGSAFQGIAGRLHEPQEEAAKQAMIAWSQGSEASALAEEDDAENEAFKTDAKQRLQLDSEIAPKAMT